MSCRAVSFLPFTEWSFMLLVRVGKLPEQVGVLCIGVFQIWND